MKVLFDVNVPKGIRHHLPHHEVVTAQEQGWGETRNGALLRAAEAAGFKVMVTADKNLTYTQNTKGRKIALVVLPTNDWSRLKPVVPRIVGMIDSADRNSYQELDLAELGPRPVRRRGPRS